MRNFYEQMRDFEEVLQRVINEIARLQQLQVDVTRLLERIDKLEFQEEIPDTPVLDTEHT